MSLSLSLSLYFQRDFVLNKSATRVNAAFVFRVIKSAFLESFEMLGTSPLQYMFNVLLFTLQVLHVIWFYMILRMVQEYILKGQVLTPSHSISSRFLLFNLFFISHFSAAAISDTCEILLIILKQTIIYISALNV
jgi:hypothetical protein